MKDKVKGGKIREIIGVIGLLGAVVAGLLVLFGVVSAQPNQDKMWEAMRSDTQEFLEGKCGSIQKIALENYIKEPERRDELDYKVQLADNDCVRLLDEEGMLDFH